MSISKTSRQKEKKKVRISTLIPGTEITISVKSAASSSRKTAVNVLAVRKLLTESFAEEKT